MPSFRILAAAALLTGCAPSFTATEQNIPWAPHIGHSHAEISGTKCNTDVKQRLHAERIASRVLDLAWKMGILVDVPQVAVCSLNVKPPFACANAAVYGCALPYINALLPIVAWQHPQMAATMAHEVAAIIGHVGKMTGWPTNEFCNKLRPQCITKHPQYTEIVKDARQVPPPK